MGEQRTYWHLASLGRRPTEYDIATSRLLYYPGRGFEVPTPFSSWYERFGEGSALRLDDWERFSDPRETTYSKYVALQRTKETFVDELLRTVEENEHDGRLSAQWLDVLERTIAPLRFPVHALEMIAAYVGHMAPAGRFVVTCLFQSADEMRRVQRFAFRMRQLQERRPTFGTQSRAAWERDAIWQPLRRTIEHLLVTYDRGEAFVALNLCLKPAFDEVFMAELAKFAQASGDSVHAELLSSLNEDCRWHQDWTSAFVRTALGQRPDNRAPIERWITKWDSEVATALATFGPIFESGPTPRPFSDVSSAIRTRLHHHRFSMGLAEGERS